MLELYLKRVAKYQVILLNLLNALDLACFRLTVVLSVIGEDLMDIHTNHNSKKMTILNQFLELNIAIAIR